MTLDDYLKERLALRYRGRLTHPELEWHVGWKASERRESDVEWTAVVTAERRRYDGPGGKAHFYRKHESYGFSGKTLRRFHQLGAAAVWIVEVDTDTLWRFPLGAFTGEHSVEVEHSHGNQPDYQRHVPIAHADRETRGNVQVWSVDMGRKWRPGDRPPEYPDDWRPPRGHP